MSADDNRRPAGIGTAVSENGSGLSIAMVDPTPPGPYGLAAPEYRAAGWHPLPLPPRAKKPPPAGFTGYSGRPVTAEQVEHWCNGARLASGEPARLGNLALRMPEDVLGLDVDHYVKDDGTMKRGAETIAAAEARLGELPATIRSTARGLDGPSGIRFYRVPVGRRWADTAGPDVEVIHHGHRYAVAWPSVNPHADGAPYLWQDDRTGQLLTAVPDPTDLAELPAAWVAELDRGPLGDPEARADDAAAAALLAAMPEGEACRCVLRLVDGLAATLAEGTGRHDATRNRVLALVRAGEQGHRGVPAALDTAEALLTRERALSDPGEFRRMVTGAAAIAAGTPTPEHQRRCCGEGSRLAGLAEGSADDTDEPGAPEPLAALESVLDETPFLRAVRDFGRARQVGPAALLGAVITRAAAEVSPALVLPPPPAVASLNLFVALCGGAGSNKTATMAVAREFLEPGGGAEYLEIPPGTGEGLVSGYVYTHTQKGRPPEQRQRRLSVLLVADEVSALGKLAQRTGATLQSFLTSAWSGGPLGTLNADTNRLRNLAPHSYRLAMLAGVQPEHAGVLLDDEGGGWPQRWLWLPTYDPGRRSEQTTAPAPWTWQAPPGLIAEIAPGWVTVQTERRIVLPPEAVADIAASRAAANVPIGATAGGRLDGHALQLRARVAALLHLLESGTLQVSPDDWRRAGVVMAVSDHTRAAVLAARGAVAQRDSDQRATRAGRSDDLRARAATEAAVVRCMRVIRRALERHGGEHTRRQLRATLENRDREHVDDAIARMREAGELIAEKREAPNRNKRQVTYYRLHTGAPR